MQDREDISSVLKVLRKALRLNMNEVKELKNHLDQALFSGTKMEMKRIQMLLNDHGVKAYVEKEDDNLNLPQNRV
ncbi:hypothetical protein [Laceyella putida]|uniref:Uncharacterized protein n=1 Tax=Laceyella putida TaxID=110101 RepID=A0ABW2RLQ5_9BACL